MLDRACAAAAAGETAAAAAETAAAASEIAAAAAASLGFVTQMPWAP